MKYNIAERFNAMPSFRKREIRKKVTEAADVHQATFYNYINGKSPDIPGAALKAFADFFGCSIEQLYSKEGERAR